MSIDIGTSSQGDAGAYRFGELSKKNCSQLRDPKDGPRITREKALHLVRSMTSPKDALAASVIVKATEKIAPLFPAYINRDNLEGGDLNVGVETKSSEYVIKELLVANVK